MNLNGTLIGDRGVKALGNVVGIGSAEDTGTRVGDEGVRHLGSLKKLEYISTLRRRASATLGCRLLEKTCVWPIFALKDRVTDAGLKHLAGLVSLHNLEPLGYRCHGRRYWFLRDMEQLTSLDILPLAPVV